MNQFLLNSHASQVCVRVCVLCAIVHRRIQSRLRLRLKECSREREGEKDKPNQTEQHSESAIVTSMGNGSTHTHTHWHTRGRAQQPLAYASESARDGAAAAAKHKDIVKIKWVALLLCIWNLQLNEHNPAPVENPREKPWACVVTRGTRGWAEKSRECRVSTRWQCLQQQQHRAFLSLASSFYTLHNIAHSFRNTL